jgi:hypothetical protein
MFFKVLFPAALLLLAGAGLGLLLWPSVLLKRSRNPWQPDTPENRVQMRGVGLIFCLFLTLVVSSFGSSPVIAGFRQNILLALWVSFFSVPIFLWVLWRVSPLRRVGRMMLTGELAEQRWELWMSLAFSGLLLSIVLSAFLLALKGFYPR